jgi:acid phosphatase
MKSRTSLFLLAALALAGAGCATEPRNLDLAKRDINAYVDSGRYEGDLAAVASKARQAVEDRVARRQPGETLAIVIDIDETALSNLENMRAWDYGYSPAEWEQWVARAKAEAIAPVLTLFKAAQGAGVETIFITGRSESQRAATARNLQAAGYAGYTRLICKPDASRQTTADFKTSARRQIAAEGIAIIVNIGDQTSDLVGGFAERTFKLPDPFYLIP